MLIWTCCTKFAENYNRTATDNFLHSGGANLNQSKAKFDLTDLYCLTETHCTRGDFSNIPTPDGVAMPSKPPFRRHSLRYRAAELAPSAFIQNQSNDTPSENPCPSVQKARPSSRGGTAKRFSFRKPPQACALRLSCLASQTAGFALLAPDQTSQNLNNKCLKTYETYVNIVKETNKSADAFHTPKGSI